MSHAISFDKPSFMVDSRNRLIGPDNIIEDFDICVELPTNNKFNQVSVSSIVIPKSYYNIVDNSVGVSEVAAPNSFTGSFRDNQFLLSEGTGSTSSALITVPLAFYNSVNFPIQMKSLLETASPTGLTYEVTYPDPNTELDTRKFTYKCLDNTSALAISFFFPTVTRRSSSGACKTNDTSRISEIMGFSNETNTAAPAWSSATTYVANDVVTLLNNTYVCILGHTNQTPPNATYWTLITLGEKRFDLESGNIYSVTSEYVIDFELTKYITIKSNISLDQGNATGDNAILGVVPVTDVPNGGLINYELQQLEDESKYLSNNKNNIYSFSLWDDHDERMKLNGINWFTKLFLYEYNPFYELAINDIKIRQLRISDQQQQQPQ